MKKKYLSIYEDLAQKIREHTLPASTLLPSENELAEAYDTSRETIRKSLNLLSQGGYIQKIQGKGSVVLDLNKFSFPVSGIVSYKELTEKLRLNSKTVVKEMNVMEAGSDIHKILKATENSQIWKVVRVREISDEKIILDKDYFLSEYVPLPSKETCEHSIYDYIEHELGLNIGFAEKEITVEEPTEEDYQLLDLEGYFNVVVIKSLVYLEDTSLFQFTESRHRPDKFRFVDFARRVKN
ncbi:GntR family transcriptional regulator, trehalose operon transcriptional repressor [Salinibacillus kushneri]|uniref:Trehalose operon repressor n=1 Tax=Salinibacillus kushneri TaxID=237682 RepID=A0A1H9YNU8_9BACI|nr:trehalose operon repressor [Salinibacillus kushneri]SES70810.1 GntR family transcriptional regulator, trehalose operon transcriptional repressor [Salinibacillus kushneri]